MKLYVIRHAIAVEAAGETRDDARPLSGEGRARFEAGVRGLARIGVRFELIVHSPLLRALQTAELLAPLLDGETHVSAQLTHAPTDELLAELAGESVALVGHEPWLSELVAWLVADEREAGHRFALSKGGLAVLEGHPRPAEMRLAAFLPPDVLRELGRAT